MSSSATSQGGRSVARQIRAPSTLLPRPPGAAVTVLTEVAKSRRRHHNWMWEEREDQGKEDEEMMVSTASPTSLSCCIPPSLSTLSATGAYASRAHTVVAGETRTQRGRQHREHRGRPTLPAKHDLLSPSRCHCCSRTPPALLDLVDCAAVGLVKAVEGGGWCRSASVAVHAHESAHCAHPHSTAEHAP